VIAPIQHRWPRKPLGEIADVVSGYAFKSSEFSDRGIPVIKIKNIRVGSVDLSEVDRVDERFLSIPERFHVRAGDILISLTGSHISQPNSVVGHVARHSASLPHCLLNQRSGKVIVRNRNHCDLSFLFYALTQPETVRAIAMKAHGAANQANVSPSQVESVEIPLPPPSVQRRIAGILSAYDELIENSQRRIPILEKMARSLYREWFVHFRFPGHEKIKRLDSPLGPIPQGWHVKKLADVTQVNHYQITARNPPDQLHYIDISSVSPGQIDTVTTYAFADAPGRARRVVQHGDVLWSCVRPNRRSYALVMHPRPNTIASTGFAVLTPMRVPFTFLYFATTTDDFVGYLTNNTTGAAYPAVTADTFAKANLLIPPDPLLKNFGDTTIPMAEQLHTLQRQAQNLRSTRALLLPRLLSGQVDLKTD
jgi:type I restriction enzyme, S subunit